MPTGKKIEKQKTSEIKCHWCGGILSCTQCGADLFYPDSPKSTGKKIEKLKRDYSWENDIQIDHGYNYEEMGDKINEIISYLNKEE